MTVSNKQSRKNTSKSGGRLGILVVGRSDAKIAPPVVNEVTLNVLSTIVDRLEGTTHTETIWGSATNRMVLTSAANDPALRAECAKFFLTRRITPILMKAINLRIVRDDDVVLTKRSFYAALSAEVANRGARDILMELITPYLLKIGIMDDAGDYSRRVSYPFRPVTTDTIAQDVAMFEIVRVMETVKTPELGKSRSSAEVFAENVGQALYDIGRKFLDVNSISSVIGDIVIGVRAHIDPTLQGLNGSVDESWRTNDVVQALSTNWVFVEAALNIPLNSSVTPTNDGWKLDKYAPGILAAIKSSARYAIVGKAEVLRNLSTTKVRNLRGVPQSVVLVRSANPAAVGMPAYAYEDASVPGAYTLTSPSERIGEVVASTYNSPNDLGTERAAGWLTRMLTQSVEAGYEGTGIMYQVDLGGYAFVANSTVAALLSTSVTIGFDTSGEIIRDAEYSNVDSKRTVIDESGEAVDVEVPRRVACWYRVPTTELDVSWMLSGRYDGDSYITSSVAEVFLMADTITATGPVDPKPQLYTAAAFNTKIVNFDVDSLCLLDDRYPFNISVFGAEIRGAIRPSDLGTMKTNPLVALVVPQYNSYVFQAVAQTFEQMLSIADDLVAAASDADQTSYKGGEELAKHLRRNVARHVLAYARTLSASFRNEIHRGMRSRATSGLTGEESIRLKAELSQKAFGAYADVFALSMFLRMQGIRESNFWTKIITDATMVQEYFEFETERDALPMN